MLKLCLSVINLIWNRSKTLDNNSRKISYEKGCEFAKDNQISFIESSAKKGYNTSYAFELLTQKIMEKIEGGLIDTTDDNGGVKLGDYQSTTPTIKKNKSKCC